MKFSKAGDLFSAAPYLCTHAQQTSENHYKTPSRDICRSSLIRHCRLTQRGMTLWRPLTTVNGARCVELQMHTQTNAGMAASLPDFGWPWLSEPQQIYSLRHAAAVRHDRHRRHDRRPDKCAAANTSAGSTSVKSAAAQQQFMRTTARDWRT